MVRLTAVVSKLRRLHDGGGKTRAAVSAPDGTARVKDGCLGRPSDDDDRWGFVGLA